MKTSTDYLVFNTRQRKELINMTDQIAEFVEKSGLKEGFVLVSAMHITAGIFVNDEEPGLKRDIMALLERLARVAHLPELLADRGVLDQLLV